MNANADHPSLFDLKRIVADSFVRRIEYHRELPSTNSLALEILSGQEVETPLLVLTERQTAGRGRGENSWWSTQGGLTFSLVLKTVHEKHPPQLWPQISLITGLAVCETLKSVLPGKELALKWPNDVYLQGRKACGILVETTPKSPDMLIIGVGLNVNNSFDLAPEELRAIATSLYDVSGQSFDLTDVLLNLLERLSTWLDRVGDSNLSLAEQWRELCMLRGRTVSLDTGTNKIVGLCRGIDDEGALLLETETGLQRCFGGVVSRIE